MRRQRPAKKHTPVDKSALAIGIPRRIRDKAYRNSAKDRPCDACGHGGDGSVVLAHISIDGNAGAGVKAPDDEAVFLCGDCHARLDTGPGKWRWLVKNVLFPMLRQRRRDWRVNR